MSRIPRGFTVGDFAATVQSMRDATLLQYNARRSTDVISSCSMVRGIADLFPTLVNPR
jgi:hypothetical protein